MISIRDFFRRRLVRDVLGFASERSLRLSLSAVVGIFLARYLGPADFGLLSYGLGIFGLLAPFALLGMPQILVREFSTEREWRSILASSLAFQVPTSVVAAAAGLALLSYTRNFERDAVLLAVALAPMPIFHVSASMRAYLEATGRMKQIVGTGIVAGVAVSALKLMGIIQQYPLWLFGVFSSLEGALLAAGYNWAMPGRGGVISLLGHFRRTVATRLFRESWPLLLSAIAVVVYMRSDLLMLGVLAGDRETGIYSAAARLSEVWYFLPASAAAAVRPRLARLFSENSMRQYRSVTQRFMTAAVGLAFALVAIILVAGDRVITLLYGAAFADSSIVLKIHILAAPFVFVGLTANQWFVDRRMTRQLMVRSTVGAILNVLLNLVLIPSFGAVGASIATLSSYASSGLLLNATTSSTRPLFKMQVSAFLLRWPRSLDRDS